MYFSELTKHVKCPQSGEGRMLNLPNPSSSMKGSNRAQTL